uniref:Metalloendopeptidase n=1 Tax=Graphocephala atropunctata TaxID=36148 RepID=A0A1B6MQ25_9HEMI
MNSLTTIVGVSILCVTTIQGLFFKDKSGIWPNSVVHYNVAPELTPEMKRSIKNAIEYLNSTTCLKWTERLPIYTLVRDYVSFQIFYKDQRNCRADLGYHMKGQQVILLGLDCYKSYPEGLERDTLLLHEMMHAMGFFHEHQRPDRDCYVEFRTPEIEQLPSNEILRDPPYWTDWPYDYQSITHYTESEGVYARDRRPIYRTDGTISEYDKQKIEFLYCNKPSFCNQPGNKKKCDEIKEEKRRNPDCPK